MLKKNSVVLYILQCGLNDEIFNHVCYCKTTKDLWEKLILLYKGTSQEHPNSSRRDSILSNLSDEKEITHFCLMSNEAVSQDASDSDDDDDDACTSDDEEEDG